MILRIADNFNSPTVLADGVAFRDRINCIVSAFRLHVRMNFMNESADIRFDENYHSVHVRKGSEEFGALFSRNERTAFTLERANGFIGVDGYDKPSAQLFGGMQVADMADMKKIETSIREDDRVPGAPPRPSLFQQCRAVQDF
jgi:hypothetical protein